VIIFAMKRAAFADNTILGQHGCEKSSSADEDSLLFSGWNFKTRHCKILDSDQISHLTREVAGVLGGNISSDDHVIIGDHNLHFPAMIFGNDIISINCDTGTETSISFTFQACDALSCWADQHSVDSISKFPVKVVQVPYAKSWSERLQAQEKGNKAVHKLYIFIYFFSVANTKLNVIKSQGDSNSGLTGSILSNDRFVWDWTFSTDYCCSSMKGKSFAIDGSRKLSATNLSLLKGVDDLAKSNEGDNAASEKLFVPSSWQKSESNGIEYDMLRSRDMPILFYDEVTLYQDDLEDCGEVSLDVKLRVMPSCWFILSRFFLRVDGSIVRVRDTRLFHRFGDDKVHMEVTWKEQTLADQVNVVIEGPRGKDGRKSTNTVSTSSPRQIPLGNKTLRSPAELAEVLPCINDDEGIHRFYVFHL
jgi:hypothetical protein